MVVGMNEMAGVQQSTRHLRTPPSRSSFHRIIRPVEAISHAFQLIHNIELVTWLPLGLGWDEVGVSSLSLLTSAPSMAICCCQLTVAQEETPFPPRYPPSGRVMSASGEAVQTTSLHLLDDGTEEDENGRKPLERTKMRSHASAVGPTHYFLLGAKANKVPSNG